MVGKKEVKGHSTQLQLQRKTSSDRMRGGLSEKQGNRKRETTRTALLIAQSINMFDVCHFLLFCDPILTEHCSSAQTRASVQIYLKIIPLFRVYKKRLPENVALI